MIRIYLDWNVISNLKKPEYAEMKEFITAHKHCFLFPYSPAHFSDLMKSYSPENERFMTDLDTLNFLSDKHLIRWETDKVEPLFATPFEYFQSELQKTQDTGIFDFEQLLKEIDASAAEVGMENIGQLLKQLYKLQPAGIEINDQNRTSLEKMFPNLTAESSMWDMIKEIGPFAQKLLEDGAYYKDFRKNLHDQGLQLQADAGNWSEAEVIKNIDTFLLALDAKMTFLEYVEQCFKHRKEPVNRYEFFTTAYLILDMIGYKSDKLPKPTDNVQNIQADAEHAFYAAHCDYFVASDKKLRTKSSVLYKQFKIATRICTPEEFLSEIKKVIYPTVDSNQAIKDMMNWCNSANIVERILPTPEDPTHTFGIQLPVRYFNFFNCAEVTYYPEQHGVVMIFRKMIANYSRFLFYTESEQLIRTIIYAFSLKGDEPSEATIKEFVYENKEFTLSWILNGCRIQLEKEPDAMNSPILVFILRGSK